MITQTNTDHHSTDTLIDCMSWGDKTLKQLLSKKSNQYKSADLGNPLCVSCQSVETSTGRQSPDLHCEVRRAADQQVQFIIVVHAED